MCGSTSGQTQVSNEENQFYSTLTSQYNTVFGESQAITGALTKAFTPILAAGPSQTGFSPGETNALETQNNESTATNYAQAQKATANILAARGGGDTLLPSSVNANLLAQNANAAAAQRSQGENAITQANYQQGYQNWARRHARSSYRPRFEAGNDGSGYRRFMWAIARAANVPNSCRVSLSDQTGRPANLHRNNGRHCRCRSSCRPGRYPLVAQSAARERPPQRLRV
jgi:hypothetical protein